MRIFLCTLWLCLSSHVFALDHASIQVKPNAKQFSITLASNPTTGYQWSVVDYDKNLLNLSQSQFKKAQSKLIGAGGTMVFTFVLKLHKIYPASTEIQFKYARAWDVKSASFKKIRVDFK